MIEYECLPRVSPHAYADTPTLAHVECVVNYCISRIGFLLEEHFASRPSRQEVYGRTRIQTMFAAAMKLRFEVNQAEASRHGIELRKPLVTIDVSVSSLTPKQRQLIEDRLEGIDVVQLHYDPKTHKAQKTYFLDSSRSGEPRQEPVRIQAELPTFDAMMKAIEANEADVFRGPTPKNQEA